MNLTTLKLRQCNTIMSTLCHKFNIVKLILDVEEPYLNYYMISACWVGSTCVISSSDRLLAWSGSSCGNRVLDGAHQTATSDGYHFSLDRLFAIHRNKLTISNKVKLKCSMFQKFFVINCISQRRYVNFCIALTI